MVLQETACGKFQQKHQLNNPQSEIMRSPVKPKFVPLLEIQVSAASILHSPIHLQTEPQTVHCRVLREGQAMKKATNSLVSPLIQLQGDAAKLLTNQT